MITAKVHRACFSHNMAGWISSKLKIAENLLHQIDQQAAESLGKTERKPYDELDFNTSPKPSGSVPVRDQLKKKTPEGNEAFAKFSSDYTNSNSICTSKEGSDDNTNNRKQQGKDVAKLYLNPRSSVLNDSDWTELLGTPKQQIFTKTSHARVLGERRVNKVRGKLENVGLIMKSNVEAIGTVAKAGNGNVGKANASVGDGRSNEEKSKNSYFSARVSVVESDDCTPEGLKSAGNIEKSSSPKEKKEVFCGTKITENGNKSLDLEKLVDNAESPFLPTEPTVLSGSNGATMRRVYDDGKEAVDGVKKIMRATLAEDSNNVHSAHHVSEDLKSSSYSGSDNVSDSESSSTFDSESEIERERLQRIEKRRQILAAKAAAKTAEAIKEHENLVARLEGEKQSLEKIVEERAKQAAQEASDLQSTTMEMMEAAEQEKQNHNHTRMEVLARLANLEITNAGLAKSLATAQWNLEVEVNWVVELRQQVEVKEVVHEELRRRISSTYETKNSLISLMPSKGIELEKEMLKAENCLLTDKIASLQKKATKLEVNIEITQKEMESSTEVEVELKQRLHQMTDYLIQKQAQVEALSSDKAMLLFRIEAVSRLLDENKYLINAGDILNSGSLREEDVQIGTWEASGSKLRPMFEEKLKSGKQHLGSLIRQLDAIFSAGALFLARNPAAKLWSLVYLVCLHLWVLYILLSHSRSADDHTSTSVLSLGNINNVNNV